MLDSAPPVREGQHPLREGAPRVPAKTQATAEVVPLITAIAAMEMAVPVWLRQGVFAG